MTRVDGWIKIELPLVRSNRALRGVITKQRKQINAMKNCGNCTETKRVMISDLCGEGNPCPNYRMSRT